MLNLTKKNYEKARDFNEKAISIKKRDPRILYHKSQIFLEI